MRAKQVQPVTKDPGTRPASAPTIRWQPHHARLAGGLALVAGSVTGVWVIVHEASSFEEYLVTTEPVLAGTPVSQVQWDLVPMGSAGRQLGFLSPEELEPTDQRVLRTDLPAGAPVLADQLRAEVPTDYTTFTTTIGVGGAPWLFPGATVEIWTSPPQADQTFSPPVVSSPLALVSGVRVEEGFAADSSIATVDLVVHRRELPELIHARANGFDIQLSPVTGQWGDPR